MTDSSRAGRRGRPCRRKPLALAIGASLLMVFAGSALAQNTQQSSSKSSETLKTIIVTGSAIPRTDLETPAPVRVITSKQIAESGLTNIADVVRRLTSDNSGTIPNAFSLGFAAGASGVALRGLRASNTLVLIDGHRVADYAVADDGTRSFVDLNTIPLQAVDRIEVLKDGASSIYGSDAIAGVVNIILKPSFQGAEASVEVGDSQHGGGFMKRVTGMFGAGNLETEGHNAYIDFMYEKDNAIPASDRAFPLNTDDTLPLGFNDGRAGNPLNNSGSNYGTVAPGILTTPGNILTGQATGPFQPLNACGADSELMTIAGTGPGTGTYCAQNFTGMYEDIQPMLRRDGVHGRFTMKVGNDSTAYIDMYYMESDMQTLGAPAQIQNGTPNNTNSIALPPLLPDGELNPNNPFAASGQYALINYAFGSTIPAYDHWHNHSLRVEADLSGRVLGWNYDTNLVINHTWVNTSMFGLINFNQLLSDVTDGTYNFVNPSANSASVLSALSPVNARTSTSDEDALDFTVNRDFGQLNNNPIGVAFGAQVRHEAQDDPSLNPDAQYQGLGIAHAIGNRNVQALFAETDLFPLPHVETDISVRWDHYPQFGSAVSPKFGIKWTPIKQLGLRGTFSRGFRAPSFSESGNAESAGFVDFSVPSGSLLFNQHNGNNYVAVPYDLEEISSANPDLKPERSTEATGGLVFQPTSWLNGTLDYYMIRLSNVITPSNPATALNAYVAGQPIPSGYELTPDLPDPAFPNALPRPLVVSSPFINANRQTTDGVDLNLVFHDHFGPVGLVSDLNATRIISFTTDFPATAGSPAEHLQYVGTASPYNLSSGAGTPRNRASWSNTLTWGPFTGTATVNYISGEFLSTLDVTGEGCILPVSPTTGIPVPPNCKMPSFTDLDLTGSYKITKHITVTGAIMNAADRSPPLDIIDYAAANYNPTYAQSGAVGRFFKLGLQVKFGPHEAPPPQPAVTPPPPPVAAPPPPPPPQKVVIDLRGVNFKFDRPKPGEHNIGPTLMAPASASLAILNQAIDTLNRYPQVQVQIDGYTDSIGSPAYNQKLSERRAEIVDQYLTSHGISPSRITGVHGFGEADPVASNKTAAGRQRNRRVEFKVQGQGIEQGQQ